VLGGREIAVTIGVELGVPTEIGVPPVALERRIECLREAACMRQAVRAGARHLAYLEAGSGHDRAILLVHAFPLNASMWGPQLAEPPDGWRVIAPDLAGLGSSNDHDGESISLDDYARDLVLLLDRLGISRAVVAGVSLGGYVAMAFARRSADRITALVLADTKAPADTPEARAGRERMLDLLSDRGTAGVADEMLPKLLGPTTRHARPELVDQVRAMALTNDPEGVRRAIIRLRDRPDATPGLPTVAVPVLVVVGEEDAVTPPAEAERLQAAIRGATLSRIGAAGHLASLEQPAAFNGELSAFLARI
jgi:pimeloyl-ACP methyl ester carboxylesterase